MENPVDGMKHAADELLTGWHSPTLIGSLLLAASAIYLYFLLFVPLATPICIAEDGTIYLTEARRMIEGQVVYRDFFEFVTPGTDWVSFVLLKTFGPKVWLPNVVLLLVGLGLVYLTFASASRLMSGGAALLAGALFVVTPYGRNLDPTHHLYSATAVMGALTILLEKRSFARVAVAGGLCGVAVCFTQSRGAMAAVGLALFLLWEGRREKQPLQTLLQKEAWLLAGFLTAVLPVIGWYVWRAGAARCYYCMVTYPLKYFPRDAMRNSWRVILCQWPSVPPWRNLPRLLEALFPFALIPWIYLLCFFRYWRESWERSYEHSAGIMLVAVVGLFAFLAVAPSPTPHRVYWGSAPALILLAWFLDSRSKLCRALCKLLWAGTILAALLGVSARQFSRKGVIEMPQGPLAILPPGTYQEFLYLHEHTKPLQKTCQVYAPDKPPIYFFLDLRDPTDVSYMTRTGYTPPEQVKEAIAALEKDQIRYVVWNTLWLGDPKPVVDTASDNLGPLRQYVQTHYQVVKSYGDLWDIVWERRP
ncbi:MAG: glycosyltransferase family 39 protein [Terriglobia bacterium]